MVTEKSPVKWSYPLFLESAKLEFYCIPKKLLKDHTNCFLGFITPTTSSRLLSMSGILTLGQEKAFFSQITR